MYGCGILTAGIDAPAAGSGALARTGIAGLLVIGKFGTVIVR